jgi:ABC-type uncharacterized transport system permease subunit
MMASYPIRFLLEEDSSHYALEIIAASAVIYLIVFIIWKKGLRDYSSASS